MGRNDKDRFQKELAVKYCLAKGLVPVPEVIVKSRSELTNTPTVLTDIDVLGIGSLGDGGLRRSIFDCKTTSKMSSVNRAFWAAGLKEYTGCDEAFVILKKRAVQNHRLSALSLEVDLHDEQSFTDLGQSFSISFPEETHYQSTISRWQTIYDCYTKYNWSEALFDISRNLIPLSNTPWTAFRKLIAEIRTRRGEFDPAKPEHLAIFWDLLASGFIVWSQIGRDMRRVYEPQMNKGEFEGYLRLYLWGGKEAYNIRLQMKKISGSQQGASKSSGDLPAWPKLLSFAGLVIAEPSAILDCAIVCRELAIRSLTGPQEKFDINLHGYLTSNTRIRQFVSALSDYLVEGGTLPSDFKKAMSIMLSEL